MIVLQREGPVFVLRLDAGENRFSPEVLKGFGAALDEVEKSDAPKALVTTGTAKFYSNGLDLEHMTAADGDGAQAYLAAVLGLLGRVLTFPAITVAAVNGHAFGAGAQLAVAQDVRLMRADRGFFCMPEIDMRVPLHPGMTALLKARIPIPTVHEVIVTGRRFGGTDAEAQGIVDEALPESDLLSAAVARAAALADKADPAMAALKRGLYAPVLEALAQRMELPGA